MYNKKDLKYKNKQMRKAGEITGKILSHVISEAKEGVSLIELDVLAEKLCYENDVEPAFKGYEGFPNTLCVGVNDTVVHGIPDDYVLQNGDIVSIDFGVKYKKAFGDSAYTVMIGEPDSETKKFVNTVKEALFKAIRQAKPGKTTGDIGHAMQTTVEEQGYSSVREMVGHGIGFDLHEDPYIPCYGKPGKGFELYEGQTIAIEAIINQGVEDITISKDDGWTTKTKDGKLSGLFEHTILVGNEPEVLTKWSINNV